MGSHITTNIKSIKTFQFDTTCSFIKSKVIAAILNCKMKTLTISNIVFPIAAIAFVANATGKRVPTYVSGIGKCFGPDKVISKCWENLEVEMEVLKSLRVAKKKAFLKNALNIVKECNHLNSYINEKEMIENFLKTYRNLVLYNTLH